MFHELRSWDDQLLAYLYPRPAYCDRGRYHANVEVRGIFVSNADPWPRYYFNLETAKSEVEAWLKAKRVDIVGATWRVNGKEG